MTSVDELACTYSALILADDDVPITVSSVSRVCECDKAMGVSKYYIGPSATCLCRLPQPPARN